MINEELTKKLEQLMQEKDNVVIAIDGPNHALGASLAGQLRQKYGCNVFRTSDYSRIPDELTSEEAAQPGGRLDRERLRTEVIEPLKAGSDVSFRVYSVIAMSYIPAMPVSAKKLNVIEGAYSMHPELVPLYDLTVFAPTDAAFANEAEALFYAAVCPAADITL